jgi:N-succinyldiaminopimelate aminotransferase
MKNFSEFMMEEPLENGRTSHKYNFGESGHAPITLQEFLTLSENKHSLKNLLSLSLQDSPNWGNEKLRSLVSSFHKQSKFGNVLITTGTSEALLLLFRQLRPKKVALLTPAFQLLAEIPQSLGATIVPLPIVWNELCEPQKNWDVWFDILNKHKPNVIVWNHPHNPSGLCFSKKELAELSLWCKKNSCILIGDEHYRFLCEPYKTGCLGLSLYQQTSYHFVTGSFIKCLGVPGLRIGWVLGKNNVLSKMQSEKNYTTHTVNPISEYLAVLALENLKSGLWKQQITLLQNNKRILSASNMLTTPPAGGLVTTFFANGVSYDKFIKQKIFLLPLEKMQSTALWKLHFNQLKKYNLECLTQKNLSSCFRIGLGSSEFKKGIFKIQSLVK